MARPKTCMANSYVLDEAIGLVIEFTTKEYESYIARYEQKRLLWGLSGRSYKELQPQPLLYPT